MTAATRYAKALFTLAQETGQQAAVAASAKALAEAVAEPSITATLSNPRLKPSQRTQLAAAMAKAVKAPSSLANTLGVLATNNRLSTIADVLTAYQTLNDTAAGTTYVRLSSAVALTDAQRTQITNLIKKQTQSNAIRLEESLDASLKGGFRAYFNGMVWDASLSGSLARLTTRLRTAVTQSHSKA